MLSIAVSIEATSEHPLAQAILERGRREQVLPGHTEQFEALSGLGAKAILRGQPCLLGSLQLMEKEGVQMNDLDREAEQLSGEGKSCVFVAEGNQAIGLIGLADVPRPSAKEAVSTLKDMGLKVAMITGDNASTAITIGTVLGIDKVVAGVLPAGKADEIRRIQKQGEVVAMVGDGINDAPALGTADLGIAIGAGTDVAIEASDITLINNDLRSVPAAIKLSHRTMKTIRQNLFWAFIYNILGIPIAAGVLYPFSGILLNPEFAAAAMALSSFSVVGNSLRLRRAWQTSKIP
ncbi:MAG: HAD-IC family P-type ATPase [Syntrophales bacterium]|nr:HAD-IC family P-type ATPase [Syntrophales bacterium]